MNDNCLEILARIDAHAARIVELLETPDVAERASAAMDAPVDPAVVARIQATVAAHDAKIHGRNVS